MSAVAQSGVANKITRPYSRPPPKGKPPVDLTQ